MRQTKSSTRLICKAFTTNRESAPTCWARNCFREQSAVWSDVRKSRSPISAGTRSFSPSKNRGGLYRCFGPGPRTGENTELSIREAEFFLSPSQSISTGTPDPVPAGLDQYKAYQVIDGAAVGREIEVVDADEKETRKLLRPLFVCIAVEEWHHDEHFASSHPRGCFVVYQLDSKTSDEKISTIDQFGLNQLRESSSDWLCVRGTLLVSGAE